MKNIDRSKPVMITGSTGYVAGWIIKKLLEEGFTIHAPVRDPDNSEKLQYINALAEKSSGKIRYFKANLLDEGSYLEAMKDCELVFHTASPFYNKVKDPQKELLDPALKGTRNILDSVNQTLTVKRVVLTSSIAAIIGDARDLLSLPGGTATEKDWNTTSCLKHMPYNYSKTAAEREAWRIHDEQDRWDLVVINPALVIGPGLSPVSTSESFRLIKQLGDGSMKWGVPSITLGVVDVRDVAEAHFRAAFTPGAEGRYIIMAEPRSFLELAQILKERFGTSYPFPKKELPKFVVWLMAPMAGITRKMVCRNMGYPYKADNSKSREKLGMQYRPVDISIVEYFQQMADHGVVKPS